MSKLFLRNTTTNGIVDSAIADIIYDLSPTAGASEDTAITNTPAGTGVQSQATKTAGGSTVAWVSGRAPLGGFTLTNTDISLWQVESNMNANVGGRYRVYKYSGGVLAELGGGPFDDGVEMNTLDREDLWAGDVADTVFAANDRLVIKYFIANVGTAASGFTATLKFNAADGSTGDSFFNIAETVAFRPESELDLIASDNANNLNDLGSLQGESLLGFSDTFSLADDSIHLMGLLLAPTEDLYNWNDAQATQGAGFLDFSDSFLITDASIRRMEMFLAHADNLFNWDEFASALLSPRITHLDPGGDQVQGLGYFAIDSGLVPATFDTSQKRNGIGSYKFDSGGSNLTSLLKTPGVLGQARRIGFYFRYDDVLSTDTELSGFTTTDTAYSGGGFTNPHFLDDDNGVYATATPAKNSAQGSILEGFISELSIPEDVIIDSIKIVYERSYSTASSIGISRVRWLIDEVEGPNHDNTDMPTADTVVEVDITTDRTWVISDLTSLKVIAEALRGDTDVPHIQSWDYVAVKVEYHEAVPILWGQTFIQTPVLRLSALPTGSGVVLRITDGDNSSFFFDGITIIPPDEWHRIAVCYAEHGTNNLEIKVFLDGVEELWVVDRATGAGGLPIIDLLYGWLGSPGANKLCWIDQIRIDDIDDLTDPGPTLMTAKLPATVNQDNFDTTGGTGAVNERPVNLANYRQQAGSSQVHQNYALQAAEVGDIDISNETFIGHMGWAIAKKGSGTGSGVGITVNGVTTAVDLTTSPALVKAAAFSEDYPSNAAGIGLRSIDGDADTFLLECGLIEAYQGPLEDILFAEYLLLVNQTAEVVDDLRANPPSSYMLRYWIREGGGTVNITAYSITSEGESPRAWPIIQSNGGSGQVRIGVPGIEVRVVMEVTEADTYVMLQHYFNV